LKWAVPSPSRLCLLACAFLAGCGAADPAAVAGKESAPPAEAGPVPPPGTQYVAMSDGTLMAISVHFPEGYVEGRRYPVIFEMSGYDGSEARGRTLIGEGADAVWVPATGDEFQEPVETGLAITSDSRQLTEMFSDAYVVVHASIRGTGCSGGEFDVYSWRSNIDGYELVEWAARQDWSDGRVSIMGHSYSGMTGFMVAATQPPSLVAVTVSGLIDDVYRGILYPGGVSNYGFPLLWAELIRPGSELIGAVLPGLARPQGENDEAQRAQICGEHVLTRPRDPRKDPLLRGTDEFDSAWYRSTALISYLNGDILASHDAAIAAAAGKTDSSYGIVVPIHVTAAWQDEQTGGRGPTNLWEHVGQTWSLRGEARVRREVRVARRLLLTNGDHNTQNPHYSGERVKADRREWVDRWNARPHGPAKAEVTVLLEKDEDHIGGRIDAAGFPLDTTRWTDLYLRAGAQLSPTAPGSAEPADSYLSGSMRQGWAYPVYTSDVDLGPVTTAAAPDELDYRSEAMTEDRTVAGPVVAELWASSNASESGNFAGTDYFIWLVDEAPDGSLTYLTRGMLRTRHDAIDWDGGRNDAFTDAGGRTETYRFWRYHSADHVTAATPGAPRQYRIEIWPVGHVFRAGHRVLIKVTRPPVLDAYYAYLPRNQPVSQNTVYHDPEHASRIILPVVPTPPLDAPPACGALEGVRCSSGT
jgi:uncharacterized protein